MKSLVMLVAIIIFINGLVDIIYTKLNIGSRKITENIKVNNDIFKDNNNNNLCYSRYVEYLECLHNNNAFNGNDNEHNENVINKSQNDNVITDSNNNKIIPNKNANHDNFKKDVIISHNKTIEGKAKLKLGRNALRDTTFKDHPVVNNKDYNENKDSIHMNIDKINHVKTNTEIISDRKNKDNQNNNVIFTKNELRGIKPTSREQHRMAIMSASPHKISTPPASQISYSNNDKTNAHDIKSTTVIRSNGSHKNNQDNNKFFMKNNHSSVKSKEAHRMTMMSSSQSAIATPLVREIALKTKQTHQSTTVKRRLEMIWGILGDPINGIATIDNLGSSVSISGDGQIVATGAISEARGSGYVKILRYSNDTNAWDQLGNDIFGEQVHDSFGHSVSLSDDGKTVAVGAHLNDDNGSSSGHVRMFRYSAVTNTWIQLGNAIVGIARGDLFGYSVSLSADGNSVAAGAMHSDSNGRQSGHVRVFTYYSNRNVWYQLGNIISGKVGDLFGCSVSLSADGRTYAAGAYMNDDNGDTSGNVRVFSYSQKSNTWSQLGNSIVGLGQLDYLGYSVSLSQGRILP